MFFKQNPIHDYNDEPRSSFGIYLLFLPLLWEMIEHEMSLQSQEANRGWQWHLINSVALTWSQKIDWIGQNINSSTLRMIRRAISNLRI